MCIKIKNIQINYTGSYKKSVKSLTDSNTKLDEI